jgi:hypothetical protein
MIYGIQAVKDIKLSNITRSLNEAIPLIKTEDRLSRNLDDRDFTDQINKEICRLASKKVLDDMVIAIDPGDIRKKHASKMECLCKIRDGSEHEIGEGYWLAKAVAADIEHKRVIPLYLEAYSQEAQEFKSENEQLFKVIDRVGEHMGEKGIYAIDRGGDRGKLYDKFLEKGEEKRFVIRLVKTRDLLHKGARKNCHLLATLLPCPYETVIIKYQDGKEEHCLLQRPFRKASREGHSFVSGGGKGVWQRAHDAAEQLCGKRQDPGKHMAHRGDLPDPLEV